MTTRVFLLSTVLLGALLFGAVTKTTYGQAVNPLTISEFMASNNTALLDEDGDASDWLEIHNSGSAAINLQGLSLTDDNLTLDKWLLPATTLLGGEYLVIFASDKDRAVAGSTLHTNFKLSSGGEYLALADSAGVVISEYAPSYPQQFADVSFGLAADGSGEYYGLPTPGAANGSGVFPYVPEEPVSQEPTASVPRGFYTTTQQIGLSSPVGAVMRYTTDGSTPTVSAGIVYTAPITVAQTTVLRAVSILTETDLLTDVSPVATFTYIFLEDILDQGVPSGWPTGPVNTQLLDYEMDPEIVSGQRDAVRQSLASIPSISIATDLDNLFDPINGIYVNAEERGQSWERPTSVELLNPDNTPAFQIDAGFRIRGGWSRQGSNPKHSMRFYFRSEYDGTLEYPLFEDEGVTAFKRLGLRTAQNNSWSFQGDGKNTFLRDIWMRDTQRDMGQPYTRSRYVHLYINGHYWGIYMTQENARDEYAESYFGGAKADYDVVKADSNNNSQYEVSAGSSAGWDALWALIEDQVVTDAEYAQIAEEVDLDNLIDSQLIRFHAGDYDGVISGYEDNLRGNNWIAMRNRVGDGLKWIFIVHDGEASMGVIERNVNIDRIGPFPTLTDNPYYLPEYFNPSWLHQALTSNAQYTERFQYRSWFHLKTPEGALTQAASLARWNARAAQVAPAILAESARWGDAKREPPLTIERWTQEVSFVENIWFANRHDTVFAQLEARNLAADPPPSPPVEPPPPPAQLILNEYNGVASDEFLKDDGTDTFFGRVQGNGGDWFELVTVVDNLDIRGWQLELWDGDNFSETPHRKNIFVFTDDLLLSNLKSGTILTIAEDVPDDPSYNPTIDPLSSDWSINFQVNSNGDGGYFTAESQSNFDTNHTDWQLIIRDTAGALVFGPVGEGVGEIASGVSSKEVAKLEENPSALITPNSLYNDGTTSTFGEENQWSSGTESQDFSGLRGEAPNAPPTAIAGPDQTVVDVDGSGNEPITLDASASIDSDGTIVTYRWVSDSGVVIPAEISPTTLFPVGLHDISLIVTDDDGAVSTDAVIITVDSPVAASGDVNCDNIIDSIDALFILQYSVFIRTDAGQCPLAAPATTLNAANGDVDGSGLVDVVDALFLLQCSVGISNSFCPEEVGVGTTLDATATADNRRGTAGLMSEAMLYIPIVSQ